MRLVSPIVNDKVERAMCCDDAPHQRGILDRPDVDVRSLVGPGRCEPVDVDADINQPLGAKIPAPHLDAAARLDTDL